MSSMKPGVGSATDAGSSWNTDCSPLPFMKTRDGAVVVTPSAASCWRAASLHATVPHAAFDDRRDDRLTVSPKTS